MISRGFFIFSSFFFISWFLPPFREFIYPRRKHDDSSRILHFSSFFHFLVSSTFFREFLYPRRKMMIPRGFFIFSSCFFREDILTENTMTQRKIKWRQKSQWRHIERKNHDLNKEKMKTKLLLPPSVCGCGTLLTLIFMRWSMQVFWGWRSRLDSDNNDMLEDCDKVPTR